MGLEMNYRMTLSIKFVSIDYSVPQTCSKSRHYKYTALSTHIFLLKLTVTLSRDLQFVLISATNDESIKL